MLVDHAQAGPGLRGFVDMHAGDAQHVLHDTPVHFVIFNEENVHA